MGGARATGVVMLGILLWGSQGSLLGGLIHNMADRWAAIGQFGQGMLNAGKPFGQHPRRVVDLVNAAASIAILVGWFAFLRRSLREMPMVEA